MAVGQPKNQAGTKALLEISLRHVKWGEVHFGLIARLLIVCSRVPSKMRSTTRLFPQWNLILAHFAHSKFERKLLLALFGSVSFLLAFCTLGVSPSVMKRQSPLTPWATRRFRSECCIDDGSMAALRENRFLAPTHSRALSRTFRRSPYSSFEKHFSIILSGGNSHLVNNFQKAASLWYDPAGNRTLFTSLLCRAFNQLNRSAGILAYWPFINAHQAVVCAKPFENPKSKNMVNFLSRLIILLHHTN